MYAKPHTGNTREMILIRLYGFAVSNYFNTVRMAPLERGVELSVADLPSAGKQDTPA